MTGKNDLIKFLLYRIEALKNNPESLQELSKFVTQDVNEYISFTATGVCEELNRASDLQLHLESANIGLPQDFLDYILKELLNNACRYSTKGTAIKLTGQKRVNGYQLTIQDQGIGFSEGTTLEDIAPYIRLNEEKSKSDGLGLGLYNVKTLAAMFDAKITLVSEPGLGSNITILFRPVDVE